MRRRLNTKDTQGAEVAEERINQHKRASRPENMGYACDHHPFVFRVTSASPRLRGESLSVLCDQSTRCRPPPASLKLEPDSLCGSTATNVKSPPRPPSCCCCWCWPSRHRPSSASRICAISR